MYTMLGLSKNSNAQNTNVQQLYKALVAIFSSPMAESLTLLLLEWELFLNDITYGNSPLHLCCILLLAHWCCSHGDRWSNKEDAYQHAGGTNLHNWLFTGGWSGVLYEGLATLVNICDGSACDIYFYCNLVSLTQWAVETLFITGRALVGLFFNN